MLGDVVGAFKSLTTVAYLRGVSTDQWPRFSGRLWQRNFHEHVIRDERALHRIRRYITENPMRWSRAPRRPAHRT